MPRQKPPASVTIARAEQRAVAPAPESENAAVRERAKELFFSYVSVGDISRELALSSQTISKFKRDGNWEELREIETRSILEDGFGSRRVLLSKITQGAADQIWRGIDHLKKRPDPPTVGELEKLSTILGNLDKLARLDLNKSTENVAIAVQHGAVSMEQIRDVLRNDPFLQSAVTVQSDTDGQVVTEDDGSFSK